MTVPESGAEILVRHLVECTPARAAIVIDGNGDDTVQKLVDAGWVLRERVDHVAGKRIRFLELPAKNTAETDWPGDCPECGGKILELWSGVTCSRCSWRFCF